MPKHAAPPPSRGEITARARQVFLDKLDASADPDGTLTDDQRAQRVKVVRREHFAAIGRKGGIAKAQARNQVAGNARR